MDVLPMILSEEDVYEMTDNQLYALASCTIDAILPFIRDYLKSNEADKIVQERVEKAYKQKIVQLDFLSSDDVNKLAKELDALTLSSITAATPIDTLKHWKESIDIALYDESSTMYIAPISGSIIRDLCDELYGDGFKDLSKKLRNASKYFREPENKAYKGTVLKRILRNQADYKIMSSGITWLIGRLERGDNPSLWRIL